jgi:hypothetical protein
MNDTPTCPRNVYVASFTEASGYRWVYSVDSNGVRVNLKCVPPGADFMPIIDDLWAELDRVDPMPGGASSREVREFRLIA